jgi:GNAT superfamily N-acetyltransferase
MTVCIERLADRPDCVETLAEWALAEWPESMRHSLRDAVLNFAARANVDRLPLGLVALECELPVGMATLALDRPPQELGWENAFVPCLAGLYVVPAWRRKGIGSALCDYVAGEALRLGFEEIHLYTVDAAEFYQARGWCRLLEAHPAFLQRELVQR